MEEETVYRVWISTGAEVGTPGVYTVFGAIERGGAVDGTAIEGGTVSDTADVLGVMDEDGEIMDYERLEGAMGDAIAEVRRIFEAREGTELHWVRSPIHDAGLGGWNVCEARL